MKSVGSNFNLYNNGLKVLGKKSLHLKKNQETNIIENLNENKLALYYEGQVVIQSSATRFDVIFMSRETICSKYKLLCIFFIIIKLKIYILFHDRSILSMK